MRFAVPLLLALSLHQPAFAQSPTRAQLQAQIEQLRAELRAKEAQFLKPSPADEQAYASLASRPDTGVIRLLPREVYDRPDMLTMRGGGAFYSFVSLTHEYGHGSDIMLSNGEFAVGFAGCDYGFIARIADQPLMSVTLESQEVGPLAAREVPTAEPGARAEQRRAGDGFTVERVRYAGRAAAEVGGTYVLRSVSFGSSDVLVAFHVVRKDDDGSVILAWHLLERYPRPELKR